MGKQILRERMKRMREELGWGNFFKWARKCINLQFLDETKFINIEHINLNNLSFTNTVETNSERFLCMDPQFSLQRIQIVTL